MIVNNPVFLNTDEVGGSTDMVYSIQSINLDKVDKVKVLHGIPGSTISLLATDCHRDISSVIEILTCYHDGTYFYLKIVPASDASMKVLAFRTIG